MEMSFWKKKPLELKEIKNEIPLVDQPLQMPGKSNEELLAELNRVAKWRLKTRWAVFGAVSMFLFTISLPHIADQVINSILQSLKIIVGQATKYDIWWFNIAYLMFFKLFTPALVLVAFITIILNSSRMKALVSELARRREKLLVPIITQLLKVGNAFGWDGNAAFYSQALLELLPYATRDEFETIPWEGQKFYIECLNHPNDAVREQARKTIIQSGSLKTLNMLKEYNDPKNSDIDLRWLAVSHSI